MHTFEPMRHGIRTDLVGAVLFALVCVEAGTALGGLFAVNGAHAIGGAAAIVFLVSGHLFGTGAAPIAAQELYEALLVAPAVGVVVLLASAASAHFAVVLATGAKTAGFGRTLRVIGLASSVHVLNWIPIVGLPLNLAAVWLAGVGLARAHGIARWRATAAAVVPAVAVALFLVVLRLAPE